MTEIKQKRKYIKPQIEIIKVQTETNFCLSGIYNGRPSGGIVYKDDLGYWAWDADGNKIRSDDYNWLTKNGTWYYSSYAKSNNVWDDWE